MKVNVLVSSVILVVLCLEVCLGQTQQERRPQMPRRNMQNIVQGHVKHIKNIPYVDDNHERQTLDLMVPKVLGKKSLPVIVYIHGGAWLGGDKSQAIGQLTPYVASNEYAAVSVGYRLSQHAIWPAQIHDCMAAIRWIRANAEKYGIDSERIGVWGASAGGHLVSMVGVCSGKEDMEGQLGNHTGVSSKVSCVVDYFGPTDFLQMDKAGSMMPHDAADSPESKLIGGPIQENKEIVATANPITYVKEDNPPFLIIHGTKDPLVPYNQSELFLDALRAAKVNSIMITVKDGGHGRGFGPDTRDITKKFFDLHLRGIESELVDKTVDAVK